MKENVIYFRRENMGVVNCCLLEGMKIIDSDRLSDFVDVTCPDDGETLLKFFDDYKDYINEYRLAMGTYHIGLGMARRWADA